MANVKSWGLENSIGVSFPEVYTCQYGPADKKLALQLLSFSENVLVFIGAVSLTAKVLHK